MKTTFAALIVLGVFAASTRAGLVAYFPVSSTDSRTFLDDVIDDGSHGVANGTTSTGSPTHTYIVNNVTRGGDVLSTIEGHRYSAGTQSIDLNLGFTWAFWVNVASSNTSDSGSDSIIGSRNGSWHKMDLTTTGSWNGNLPSSGSYATLADDTWHFIAYVGDTTSRRIYKDGVKIAEDLVNPTLTNTDPMEIGGSSKFSEDVTGLYDEISIWNERLTNDEWFSLYELTSRTLDEGLLYTTDEFNQLKGVHDAATGSVTIGTLTWNYATNLTEAAGLTLSGSTYTVVLDDAAGTGLTAAIPEPATFALFGLGGLMMIRRRRSA